MSFRGHGQSDGYEKLHTYTMDDYVEDAYRVLQTFEQKPIIIGHSMGGAVVQKKSCISIRIGWIQLFYWLRFRLEEC